MQLISIAAYGHGTQAKRHFGAASKQYPAGKYDAAKEELIQAKNYKGKVRSGADKEIEDKATSF